MHDRLRRQIERELEPGEKVLWADRPSVLHYVLRKLPLALVLVAGAVAVGRTFGADLAQRTGDGGQAILLLGGIAALTIVASLGSIWLRTRTAYAITDRRLIRTGGRSILTNRPGQTFSYRPDEVRLLEFSNFGLSHHVFVDRQAWAESHRRNVLIGFWDVRDARAVRDRVEEWLDAWQLRHLSDAADGRVVGSADHGFRLTVPASWTVQVGAADDGDADAGLPSEWTPAPAAWDGQQSGWSRLRVTGPAGAALAVEVIRGADRSSHDMNPTVERALSRYFGMDREPREVQFADRPATLTTWSAHEFTMRVLEIPNGAVEYRLYLVAPSTMPRLMEALQTIAGSFQMRAGTVAEAEHRPAPHGL